MTGSGLIVNAAASRISWLFLIVLLRTVTFESSLKEAKQRTPLAEAALHHAPVKGKLG